MSSKKDKKDEKIVVGAENNISEEESHNDLNLNDINMENANSTEENYVSNINPNDNENPVEGDSDVVREKVTCIFLVNVKYNKDIKKIGESIELDEEEALFLEENEILKIVR